MTKIPLAMKIETLAHEGNSFLKSIFILAKIFAISFSNFSAMDIIVLATGRTYFSSRSNDNRSNLANTI